MIRQKGARECGSVCASAARACSKVTIVLAALDQMRKLRLNGGLFGVIKKGGARF